MDAEFSWSVQSHTHTQLGQGLEPGSPASCFHSSLPREARGRWLAGACRKCCRQDNVGLCGALIYALFLWRTLNIPDRAIPQGHVVHRENCTGGETESHGKKMAWSQRQNQNTWRRASSWTPCPSPTQILPHWPAVFQPALEPMSPLTASWPNPFPGPYWMPRRLHLSQFQVVQS